MQERAISLGILLFAAIYMAASIALKPGTLAKPGPGFMPSMVAVLLLLVAAIHSYNCFRQPDTKEEKKGLWNIEPMGIALMTIAYPFALKALNFIIPTVVILFIMLRLLRYKSVLTSLLIALATTLLSLIIFYKLLGVILPSGPLEDVILALI